jgi:hypothetical protein
MSIVGFELTIPVFEGSKTVHALDSATTVMGPLKFTCPHKILSLITEQTRYVETKDYLLIRDVYNMFIQPVKFSSLPLW